MGPTSPKSSLMYPGLHEEVMAAVSSQTNSMTFAHIDTDANHKRKYSTHAMARFKCPNSLCSQDNWGSLKVALLIRLYWNNSYNAVVFNQRCKKCNTLGQIFLDEESYIDRVVYRLNTWAGVAVQEQPFQQKKGPPHRSELCEGCKRGICREGTGSYDVLTPLIEHRNRR